MNITVQQINEVVLLAAAVIGAISHLAAIVGHPEWMQRIKPLATFVDFLAGNYGKAKNAK